MGRDTSLRLESVTKRFGGLVALEDVCLEIGTGERRAIIGPNGAGKTTLFNIIAGEAVPTSGRIVLYGEDITRLPCHSRVRRGVARTFQITNLFSNLTVMENLVLAVQGLERTKFAMLRPMKDYSSLYERGMELLDWIGLGEMKDMVVHELSYGVQRQVEIMLALTREPKILLLDEPTAGLSLAEAGIMVEILKKLPRSISIILIEHAMDVAFELGDRITVFSSGKIVAEGTEGSIRSNRMVQETYLGAGSIC